MYWQGNRPAQRKSQHGTGLIAKACDILDVIGREPNSITVAELVRRVGIPRPTLYRIIAALVSRGLVQSDPLTQAYTLGFRVLEYAQNVWASGGLISIAAVELRRLRDATGETAYLAVLHNRSVLTIGKFEGAHTQRSVASLGVTKPLHCTSQGKALLAFLPDAKLETLIQGPLERFTDHTITDHDLLRAQLAIVRHRGYAIDDEEILRGTRCVAAPVLDRSGYAVASISVAGPTYRLTSNRAEQLGPELMEATRRISVQLNGGASRISPRDRDAAIEVVPSNRAFQGISPIWDSESHALFWADKLAPSIQMSGRREWTMTFGERSNPIDAAILGPQDVAVLIAGHMLRISHNRIVGERAMPNLTGVRAIQPDPHGTLWAAIASEQAGTTTFARLTKEGNLEEPCSLPGEIGNFAWDRSGERVYATDPAKGAVFALDVKAKRARIFARIPKASGLPAGLATDVDGRVWVALYDGWSVVRLDADGEFESVLALPVPRPTALAFGGADGTTLYITTASIGLPIDILENAPLSGHVLSTVTSVRGYVVPLAEYVI